MLIMQQRFLRTITTLTLAINLATYPQKLIQSMVIEGQRITYKTTHALHKSYLREDFFVEYPDNIQLDTLDESILTIPFITSIIPVVWLSGRTYTVASMDEDLYYALERIHTVFKIFYPSAAWSGKIVPENLVKNSSQRSVSDQKIAVLFSHGLDAVYTSMRNSDKDQLLITIWGSDVKASQTNMWNQVKNLCQQYATDHGYEHTWVQSNFSTFIVEKNILRHYPSLKRWWGLTSQDLNYCALTAPLLYSQGITDLVMAASFTIDYPYPYGTHPLIANQLRFCSSKVRHDSDVPRTQKIQFIKQYCAIHQEPAPLLRVCWGHQEGRNCSRCEKCFRTILSLLFEAEDPKNWGFEYSYDQALTQAPRLIPKAHSLHGCHRWFWDVFKEEAHTWLTAHAADANCPMRTVCSLICKRNFQQPHDHLYDTAYTALFQSLWHKTMTDTLTDQDLDEALHTVQSLHHDTVHH